MHALREPAAIRGIIDYLHGAPPDSGNGFQHVTPGLAPPDPRIHRAGCLFHLVLEPWWTNTCHADLENPSNHPERESANHAKTAFALLPGLAKPGLFRGRIAVVDL